MITITQITPAKNATNVSVNQDLEIRISADFKLDPRNISFRLNDVDIIPNVFSVYNGATSYELIVTLYTRKRIKFGDEYRYGQLNTKYGMRDIHPSILEYGCRYVCSFTVWGNNFSNEKEELTDSFVFSTEEGVFYNSKPTSYFYSDHTQSMANKLPEWSKARFDKYSNFQQLLNPIGEVLEKTQDAIDKVFRNNLIQTVNLQEIPYLFKYELDKNFEFQNFFNQDGSMYYVQPNISGIQGITRHDLFTTEENTLKSFGLSKLPTRLNTNQIFISNNVLFDESPINDLKIDINKKLEREGSFVLYCKNVPTSITRIGVSSFLLLKAQIKGVSIFNKKIEEEIVIYNEKFLYTKKLWKRIDSIQFFNVKSQGMTFKIMHFPDSTKMSPDTKRIILPDGSSDLVVWSLENRDNISVLQKRKTMGQNGVDVLKNSGMTEVLSEAGMFDIDGITPLKFIDIAVDYDSNFIYGVTDDYLLIFDKREPYPEKLKKIPGNNGAADFMLQLDLDGSYLENGEKQIGIGCIHLSPGRKIVKYRIKITRPDDVVEFLLKDGSVTSDPNSSSILVKQTNFMLETIANRYVAEMPGEYFIELETMYEGGVISKDVAFFYIQKNVAIAKYKLNRILNLSVPVTIIKDFDQKIKIYTNENMLHTIIFHKDGIVIDYINKILYSAEEYSSIDIE
jgi:hypothetical protein